MSAALRRLAGLLLVLLLLRPSWAMLPDEPGTQYDLAVSGDGRMAATCGNEPEIHLWSVPGRKLVHLLRGHHGFVYALAFSPDGRRLASGSGDGTIRLWDVRGGRALRVLARPGAKVRALAWLPDGRAIAASWDGRLHRIEVAGGRTRALLPGVAAGVLRVSPDGRWLAVAGGGATVGRVVLWDVRARRTSFRYAMTWAVEGVDVARDGRVVGGSGDGHVDVWRDGRLVFDARHDANVYFVRFSPDGSRILTVGDRAVRLLDARDGRPILDLKAGSYDAFLPDGRTILSSDRISDLRLLDAATGAEVGRFSK